MPSKFKALSRMRLLQIAGIEAKVLDMYDKDPSLVHDKPQLFKQMKQAADVLEGESSGSTQQTINVDKLQLVVQGVLDK
jgi:hypothetical protein